MALVFWGQPTGKTILLLAGLLLVALALIEFLSQPPQPTAATPRHGAGRCSCGVVHECPLRTGRNCCVGHANYFPRK
jgi:hypothetical protein